MYIFNNVLAGLVGLFFWGITIALSGGIGPLGTVGGSEGLLFFMPVLIFAIPLAVSAMVRGRTGTGTGLWLIALAPVFGFGNFAIALGISSPSAVGDGPSGLILLLLAGAWAALLGVCLPIRKPVTPP